MKKIQFTLFLFVVLSSVGAATSRDTTANVFSYSGSLGEPGKVSSKDAKFSIQLEGETAREMFDALGTNRVDPCGAQPGVTFRSSTDGELVCTNQKNAGAYSCTFGIDAKRARLISGSIC